MLIKKHVIHLKFGNDPLISVRPSLTPYGNPTIDVLHDSIDVFLHGGDSDLKCVNLQRQALEVSCKKRCSEKFRKIHKKAPAPESSLRLVFSWEFCEILKNTFLTEQLRATASRFIHS